VLLQILTKGDVYKAYKAVYKNKRTAKSGMLAVIGVIFLLQFCLKLLAFARSVRPHIDSSW
jgi:hypothetical protein